MGGNPSVHFTTFFVLPLLCELRLNCGHIYLHGKMPSSSLFVEYRKDHRNLLIFTLYQYQYSRYCVNVCLMNRFVTVVITQHYFLCPQHKDLPVENTTDCLSTMANICRVMIENP